jgi:hypothetical protein
LRICRDPTGGQCRRRHAIEVLVQKCAYEATARGRGRASSRKDIDPTPAVDVVWRSRGAALRGRNKMSSAIQGCSASRNVAPELWPGAP